MTSDDKDELADMLKDVATALGLDGCVLLTKKGSDACFIGGGMNASGKNWCSSVRQAIDLLYKTTNEESDKKRNATPNN